MEANLVEYERQIDKLDKLFILTGLRLLAKKPRSVLIGVISNWVMPATLFVDFFFLYMILFEYTDLLTMVQHLWSMLAVILIIPRFCNRLVHWDDQVSLIEWFRDIFTRNYAREYQDIVDRHLKRTNFLLRVTILAVLCLFPPGATAYAILPFITGSGELPTPATIGGVRDVDWPRKYFVFLYLDFSLNGFLLCFSVMAEEAFFMFNVVILSTRFGTITEILKLLNYGGVRDRQKDKRILTDCYLMHLEVIKKTQTFHRYYSTYGMWHVSSVLLIDAILLYSLMERGFDMCTVGVYLAIFFTMVVPTVMSQILTNHAELFYQSIYNGLDWHEFHVEEQKMVLLMIVRTQKTITLSPGGLFALNFPLITKVIRMQASLCALLQNI